MASKNKHWRGQTCWQILASSPTLNLPASRKWNFAGTFSRLFWLRLFYSSDPRIVGRDKKNNPTKLLLCLKSVLAVLAPHRYNTQPLKLQSNLRPPEREQLRLLHSNTWAPHTHYPEFLLLSEKQQKQSWPDTGSSPQQQNTPKSLRTRNTSMQQNWGVRRRVKNREDVSDDQKRNEIHRSYKIFC